MSEQPGYDLDKAHSLVRELLTAVCTLLQWAHQPDSVFATPLDFPPQLHDICLSHRSETVRVFRDFFRSVALLFQFLKLCDDEWEETVKSGNPVMWCGATGASAHCWTANFATHVLQAIREAAGVEEFKVTKDCLPNDQMEGLLAHWGDIRPMLRLVEIPNQQLIAEYLISEYHKAQERRPSERGDSRCRNDEKKLIKPRWDGDRRELWYRDQLCKEYGRQAPNRELVLNSFEELRWPERIDDPLPQGKLADTIKSLQKDLRDSPIVIERDGTGKGIRWRKRDNNP